MRFSFASLANSKYTLGLGKGRLLDAGSLPGLFEKIRSCGEKARFLESLI